jgi:hypothetical protein
MALVISQLEDGSHGRDCSSPSQPTIGLEAVRCALPKPCLGSDTGFLLRLREHVDDWYQTLNDRGDDRAASVVFERALEDKELFPEWSR